jgi:hypothetical protein
MTADAQTVLALFVVAAAASYLGSRAIRSALRFRVVGRLRDAGNATGAPACAGCTGCAPPFKSLTTRSPVAAALTTPSPTASSLTTPSLARPSPAGRPGALEAHPDANPGRVRGAAAESRRAAPARTGRHR